MHWNAFAISIAAFAAFLAWVAPGQAAVASFGLLGLAFIICLGGLTDAIKRCANALEKRN
jgi:hypothetical protein